MEHPVRASRRTRDSRWNRAGIGPIPGAACRRAFPLRYGSFTAEACGKGNTKCQKIKHFYDYFAGL